MRGIGWIISTHSRLRRRHCRSEWQHTDSVSPNELDCQMIKIEYRYDNKYCQDWVHTHMWTGVHAGCYCSGIQIGDEVQILTHWVWQNLFNSHGCKVHSGKCSKGKLYLIDKILDVKGETGAQDHKFLVIWYGYDIRPFRKHETLTKKTALKQCHHVLKQRHAESIIQRT